MSATLLASAVAQGGAATLDSTGADFIAVGIANGFGGSVTDSIGGNSNTFSGLTEHSENFSNACRIWYCQGPGFTGASHSFQSSSGDYAILVMAFSGSLSTPLDQQNGNGASGVGTQKPGSITPSQDNEVIISVTAFNSTVATMSIDNSMSIPTGLNVSRSVNNQGGAMAWKQQATAAAIDLTWTLSSGTTLIETAVASFKFSGGGGGGGTTRGTPFGHRGTAFNGGRTFHGIINKAAGLIVPDRRLITARNDPRWGIAA
jgi:hypothetical protein